MLEDFMELLDRIAPLIYVIIPAVAAVWWKLKDKIKKKKQEVQIKDQNKAREMYNIWEHEESKNVITKIKNFCNLYKDKGTADLVQYLQLENGTVATSKIQNMFMTCLAEDDRFGMVPKFIKDMQRMPYSEVATWVDKLMNNVSDGEAILCTPDLSKVEYNRMSLERAQGKVGSVMVAPVFDPNEILLGICVFYYYKKDYDGQEVSEREQLAKFRNSVENVLFVYHEQRKAKKIEYGVIE